MLGQATETWTLEVLEASDVKCLYEIIKITLAYLKLSIPFKTQQRESLGWPRKICENPTHPL